MEDAAEGVERVAVRSSIVDGAPGNAAEKRELEGRHDLAALSVNLQQHAIGERDVGGGRRGTDSGARAAGARQAQVELMDAPVVHAIERLGSTLQRAITAVAGPLVRTVSIG